MYLLTFTWKWIEGIKFPNNSDSAGCYHIEIPFIVPESILESKGMGAIIQNKGKKMLKRAKYLKIWAEMYEIWKYLEKGQVIACDNRTQYTVRIGPAFSLADYG